MCSSTVDISASKVDGWWMTQDVGETALDENGLPALAVRVTDVNCHGHLEGLVCFVPFIPPHGLADV